MRLVSFEFAGEMEFRAVFGDDVFSFVSFVGESFDIDAAIERFHASGWSQMLLSTKSIPLGKVRLPPPILRPGKVICMATIFMSPRAKDNLIPIVRRHSLVPVSLLRVTRGQS